MKKDFYEKLCKVVEKERIFRNEPMSRHTTFRTGGPAEVLVTPAAEELEQVIRLCYVNEESCQIIGNGSNLLVSDQGIPGVVVEIGKPMSEIWVEGNQIIAQAGAMMSAIASQAAEHALTGFEFASGIPGTIGGAVVMNAGAYGGELKDVLVSVKVLDSEGTLLELPADTLELSYRYSIIPEKHFTVVEVCLKLTPGTEEAIRGRMDELKEQRVSKQPLEYPSAGSTFKRPEGYFAGKLIQDAGLRGYTVGGAQVSEKHCGFVINRGGATSMDIITLIRDVQKKVKEDAGVDLETEVKLIGF